jgi:N-acetylmuramoyl-L-alanine amidase
LPEEAVVPTLTDVPGTSADAIYTIDAAHALAGPNVSTRISLHKRAGLKPRFIVLHYTAGGPASASVAALEKVGLSAHVVVDRDGSIIHTVPFDHIAYHAGESEWEGYSGLNEWAIGIEIANYGWLPPQPDGAFQRIASDGKPETPRLEASQVLVADHPNGWPRAYGWELYPVPQLAAVKGLCEALMRRYPEIVDIVGHDEISPARKQDPGPALNLAPFRHIVEARNVDKGRRYEVLPRDGANLRGGPGTEFKVLRNLPEKTEVYVKSRWKDWITVDVEGDGAIDGFVHASLLRRIA